MEANGNARQGSRGGEGGEVGLAVQAASLRRIALFLDYDNVRLRDDRYLSPGEVLEAIRKDLGSNAIVQLGNMYLGMGRPDDPTLIDRSKLYQAYSNGIKPVPTPSFRGNGFEAVKDLTDSSALVDIVTTIFTHPEIDAYIVVTGDKDFLPAVRALREHGKAVRLYYRRDCATVLACEIDWLKGDSFSGKVDLEALIGC